MEKYDEIKLETALSFLNEQICLLPASAEEKRPVGVKWTNYRTHLPTEEEVRAWFRPGRGVDAIAIPTGTYSKGPNGEPLFCADCDDPDPVSFRTWFESAKAADASLAASLTIEKTPGGEGKRHIFWRAPVTPCGNKVFARYADGRIRFESRFEGGLAIVSPSKSGGYHLVQGNFATIPTISAEQHQLLIGLMEKLDETVAHDAPPTPPEWDAVRIVEDDTRPGADFNRRGADDFVRILEEHGWKVVGRAGANIELQRPGKEGRGLSATFNGVCLYNFSTNAAPFKSDKGYSPFHAFALLVHGGDFSKAATDLAARGYGGLNATIAHVTEMDDAEATDPATEVVDPGLMDAAWLDVPGLIHDIAAYTEATSARSCPLLAYAGALAFVAHLAGLARCSTIYDDRPNIFQLCLAPSAAGKSFAMRTNRRLAKALGIGSSIATNLASGPALEDAFIRSPMALLATIDEFQKLLGAMRSRDSALANGMAKAMLEFYSASRDTYVMRKLALPANGRQKSLRPESLDKPHLTVQACGIGEFVFQNLTVDNLADGLLGRFLLFETNERSAMSLDGRTADLPRELLDRMNRLIAGYDVADASAFRRSTAEPTDPIVKLDKAAEGFRREIAQEEKRLCDAADDAKDAAACALWGRVFEKTMKLALVFGVSVAPEQPVITKPLLERAWKIATHCTRRLLYLADSYTSRNPYDEMAKRVLRHLREYGRPMLKSTLLRRMRESVRDLDAVLETLVEARQIVARKAESGGGRKPLMISLVTSKGK